MCPIKKETFLDIIGKRRFSKMEQECSICHKVKIVKYRSIENKPLCNRCYRKIKKEKCILCNKIRIVCTRDQHKNPICKNCRAKNTKEKCSICNNLRVVSCRKTDGFPICAICKRKQNLQKCDDCGKMAPLCKNKTNNKMLCSCAVWTAPKTIYKKFLNGAKSRNLDFLLSEKEFLKIISLPCYYCGKTHHVGIDRKDNAIGYTKTNSLPCCGICNFMKGKMEFKLFIIHINYIYKNLFLE
jgi:hypothetical protein